MSDGPTVVTVRAGSAEALLAAAARKAEALKRHPASERVLIVYGANAASLYTEAVPARAKDARRSAR